MLDTCPKWSSSWYAVQFSIFMNVARGRIPVLPRSLLLYHYQLCTLLGVWMMFWHCINFSGGRVSPTRDCSICEVGWENPHGCCPSSQPASVPILHCWIVGISFALFFYQSALLSRQHTQQPPSICAGLRALSTIFPLSAVLSDWLYCSI